MTKIGQTATLVLVPLFVQADAQRDDECHVNRWSNGDGIGLLATQHLTSVPEAPTDARDDLTGSTRDICASIAPVAFHCKHFLLAGTRSKRALGFGAEDFSCMSVCVV